MAEEKENNKEWNFSRMGKQTNKDFDKAKTPLFYKQKAPGCTDCDIVYDEPEFNSSPNGASFVNYKIHLSSGPLTSSIVVWEMVNEPLFVGFDTSVGFRAMEMAKKGDKIYFTGHTHGGSTLSQSTGLPPWTWYIAELQLNNSCTAATLTKIMPITPFTISQTGFGTITTTWTGFPLTLFNFGQLTTNTKGQVMGLMQVQDTNNFSHFKMGVFDVNGSTANLSSYFDMDLLPGYPLTTTNNTTWSGDYLYLPLTNTILGVNPDGRVSNVDIMSGAILGTLDTIIKMNIPNPSNYQWSMFCFDGKPMVRKMQEDHHLWGMTVPDEIWEITIDALGNPISYNSVGFLPEVYLNSDAGSDCECCNPGAAIIYGCMDPFALSFDPLATADCNGVVGGSDTSCCEYPCHRPHGWEPPRRI